MRIHTYLLKTLRLGLTLIVLGGLLAGAAGIYVWWWIAPDLPSTESLKNVNLQVPLRVYSIDNAPIAEFGEQRRAPLSREAIPPLMIKAVLAIEDARFYEHPGVDFKGMLRAALQLLRTGEVKQGASTITMQLARNFFLSPERTFSRKLKEVLLALRIETELSKDEILTLYLNKIFFGNRAYGVAAAAQIYYGTDIQNLSLAQYAMLAGLPKAPSANNPLANPERALIRRNYILKRMRELEYINEEEYQQAVQEPVSAQQHKFTVEVDAAHVAEMVRDYMLKNFGEEAAYTGGYKVVTTVSKPLQSAAQFALRKALLDYDMRHGYRGPSGHADLPPDWQSMKPEELLPALNTLLENRPIVGNGLLPAVVLQVHDKSVQVYAREAGMVEIGWAGLSWANRYISDWRRGPAPKAAKDILKAGDLVYIVGMEGAPSNTAAEAGAPPADKQAEAAQNSAKVRWWLAEPPDVEGALVSLNPDTGAIVALAGGFDFYQSKFNRVIQAERQPGSNFKPFIYSAALENGFTPASVINDAPLVYYTATQIWRPDNYSGKFYGPTPLRKALAFSRNLVSIRLLESVGVPKAIDYVTRFGFPREKLPANLTLALGTPSLTPLDIAAGFAVFANGGYRVEPYFIERIENYDGQVLYQAKPRQVCRTCNPTLNIDNPDDPLNAVALPEVPAEDSAQYAPRVIDPQNAWLITSMLKDVIRIGTARRALVLNRPDLAGKTGTTNEQRDAWFSGYNADFVTTAWVGFDQPRSLGSEETGGRAALPMWIDFMREALRDRPARELPEPPGLVTLRIDPDTGLLARSGDGNAITEMFQSGHEPTRYAAQDATLDAAPSARGETVGTVREQLF